MKNSQVNLLFMQSNEDKEDEEHAVGAIVHLIKVWTDRTFMGGAVGESKGRVVVSLPPVVVADCFMVWQALHGTNLKRVLHKFIEDDHVKVCEALSSSSSPSSSSSSSCLWLHGTPLVSYFLITASSLSLILPSSSVCLL